MTRAGVIRKANVGISNDNEGEKPSHRKTKVSCINVNRIRVSRGLRYSLKAKPMEEQVNIPVLLNRVKWGRRSESPAH